MLLSNIHRVIKDIGYLGLLRVEHTTINKEFILDLDTLVYKGGGGAIRKGFRVLKLNYKGAVKSFYGQGASLGSGTGIV